MSQENATLAWRAAHAWGEGGAAAILPFLDPEIEWHPPQGRSELGGYLGDAGVCEYLGRFDETVRRAVIAPVRVHDLDDDRVISLLRVNARDEASAEEIEAELGWLINVRGAKFVKVRTFTSHERVFEAAGLRG